MKRKRKKNEKWNEKNVFWFPEQQYQQQKTIMITENKKKIAALEVNFEIWSLSLLWNQRRRKNEEERNKWNKGKKNWQFQPKIVSAICWNSLDFDAISPQKRSIYVPKLSENIKYFSNNFVLCQKKGGEVEN